MNRRTLKIAAALLGFVLLYLFLRNIDFEQVRHYLSEVGWKFGWVLLVTGLGYGVAAVAWMLCFRELQLPNALWKLFVFRQIGETLAVVNPTSVVAGDAAKIYFLKRSGVPVTEASAATLLARMLLVISLIVLLIGASIYFIDTIDLLQSRGSKIGLLVAMLVTSLWMILLLVHPRLYLSRLSGRVLKVLNLSSFTRLRSVARVNFAMADYFKQHRFKFMLAFILSILHWLTGATEFYLILSFLGIDISMFAAAMLEMGVVVVKSIGAFVPGQIGVEEQGNRLMLLVIGVSTPGIWVTVSIFRRARQVFWLLVGALMYAIWYRVL